MKDKNYSSSHVKQINEDGSVRFRLTEMKVDRQGEVVIPTGADLKNFKTNPIVLFGHGQANQVPIGKIDTDTMKISDDYIDANVIFHDDGTDPFATMIAEKVRKGFLNAGSIGFKPKTVSDEPIFANQTGVTHKEWELMEFSVVPIPALPSALAEREWSDFSYACKQFGHSIGEIFEPNHDSTYVTTTPAPEFVASYPSEEKAGRVLSNKNVKIINNAVTSLDTALVALKDLLEMANVEQTAEPIPPEETNGELSSTSVTEILGKLKEVKTYLTNPEA